MMKFASMITCLAVCLLSNSFLLFSGHALADSQLKQQSLSAVQSETCKLTLGLSEWLPYQSISDSGEPYGFQIELLKQIISEADCQLSYQSVKFSDGIKALAAGKLDVMMNATISEERQGFAYFSIPYRNEFMLLYSNPEWLARCQKLGLRELVQRGFRLAVQKDVVFGKELQEIQTDPELNQKLIYINNDSPHVDLVKKLNVDGIIDDPVVVAYLSTINKTGNSLKSCPIKISSSPVSFMFSKKSVPAHIVNRFNQAIRTIQSTSQYKKRWNW